MCIRCYTMVLKLLSIFTEEHHSTLLVIFCCSASTNFNLNLFDLLQPARLLARVTCVNVTPAGLDHVTTCESTAAVPMPALHSLFLVRQTKGPTLVPTRINSLWEGNFTSSYHDCEAFLCGIQEGE